MDSTSQAGGPDIAVAVVAALPAAPSSGELAPWATGRAARHAVLELYATGANETLTGPVAVCCWHAGRSKWVEVALLDEGDNIAVEALLDRAWPLYDLAALYTHVTVRAAGGVGTVAGVLRLLETTGAL